MSRRPLASATSRSPPEASRTTLPSIQSGDLGPRGSPRDRYAAPYAVASQLSPPATTSRTSTPGDEWRAPPSRDLGVRSILNPIDDEGRATARRPSIADTGSPISANGANSYFGASPSTVASLPLSAHQATGSPPAVEGYAGNFPRRRILTPKSPRMILTGHGPPGTIDAQQSPFLSSRGGPYTPNTDLSPMPTPPAQPHSMQQYGFPPISSALSADRRSSLGTSMSGPGRMPLSQCTSPSLSTSSQLASGQQSPQHFTPYLGPSNGNNSYFPSPNMSNRQQSNLGPFVGHSTPMDSPYSGSQSRNPSPAGSKISRQSSSSDPIQVLSFSTQQGVINIPVDVHQASRLADEKRARNAGASARFRQRRKEKEKDASINIDKLQSQIRDVERRLRDMEQERDFYRAERDRLRDVIYRTPSIRDIAMQGPPSPASTRKASFPGNASSLSDEGSERAPRRRRTDVQGEFTPLPQNLPSSATPATTHTGTNGTEQGPSLPPLRIDNTAAPRTVQQTPNAPPNNLPPPYDPYTRGVYERGWPADGSRR